MALRARLLALLVVAVAMVGGLGARPAHAADDPRAVHGGHVALAVAAAPPIRAQDGEWAERRVDGITLRHAPHQAERAGWYLQAADEAYRQVADIFGVERRPITIVLFPDEDAYVRANPLAARAEGVLGHARPTANEIGLALSRLEEQSEALRRDTIRHELAHIALGELSDQRLPIGFQEGIAQYVEQDPEGRERVARGLRRGIDEGQLLSLTDLNRTRPFMGRAWFAYPQSYSMVAFLVERHGMGKVVELVRATRDAETLDDAARRAFGQSMAEIEGEWRAFLPGFVASGYLRNELDIWEMAAPRAALAEARYAEARDGFERAARLFEGLGRAERLAQARDGAGRAALGIEATELSHMGAAALGGYEYERAAELLSDAEARWAGVPDGARRASTLAALEQARQGIAAGAELDEARRLLDAWSFGEARERALAAGRAFAALGDEARTEEANEVMAQVRETQNRLAQATIGAGVAGLGVAGGGWLFARRRRSAPAAGATLPVRAGTRAAAGGAREWSL